MRLIQFEDRQGSRKVGIVCGKAINVVSQVSTMHELALLAIAEGNSLERQAQLLNSNTSEDYAAILKENRILAPLDHADPAHCLVSGTGLTHLGSASTRDKMHQKLDDDESAMTDTMRMFKWGLEGGRPGRGKVGAQPEWFYKGDGDIVVNPGAAFPMPEFAEDAGEEPELTGLYIIGDDGQPHRLGFAIGNEFSDHVVERKNYLYLAHSKLRYCSFGPELLVGELPANLVGMSRIRRERRPRHLGEGIPLRPGQHVPRHREPGVPPLQVQPVPAAGRHPRAFLRHRDAVVCRRRAHAVGRHL